MKLTKEERGNWKKFRSRKTYKNENNNTKLSEEKKEKIIEKLNEGWGIRHICKKLKTGDHTIEKIRREMND